MPRRNEDRARAASGSKNEKDVKKKRVRACDQCRRRKVRCDGGEIPIGSRCTNCITFGYECTYIAATEKRFADTEYVKGLEEEVAQLRERLSQLEAGASRSSPSLHDVGDRGSPGYSASNTSHSTPILSSAMPLTPDARDDIEEDVNQLEALVDGFKSVELDVKHTHFLGRSSGLVLLRTALALKQEYGQGSESHEDSSSEANGDKIRARRPEFWDAMTLLAHPEPPHPADAFPHPVLMSQLVDEYFRHINAIFPVLHRPTFEHGVRTGQHLTSEAFGSILLLVCAIGARFSSDPSVLPKGTQSWHWAGWDWFLRVNAARKMVHMQTPRVLDLQVCNLLAYYVAASPVPHAVYAIVGHGVRLAQDMGAHRRTTYSSTPTVEDELKKRAFWCLVAMDRGLCHKLGRPYNIHDEEFDVDLLIECDDEYWTNDDPNLAFKQPEGKPSLVALFNCMLRLGRIHGDVLRNIYSPRLSVLRAKPEDAQRVVSELDSELNKFMDSVPDHLKWDPNQPNTTYYNQSAILHVCYYSLQITVHRSFIPLPQRPSPLSFPSLAICTNAARSCIHVLDRQYVRLGTSLYHHWHQMSLFSCSVILLINAWNAKRAGASADPRSELDAVEKAMRLLQSLESRWSTAGRLWDVLYDIVSVIKGHISVSSADGKRPQKRQREEDMDLFGGQPHAASPFTSTDHPTPLPDISRPYPPAQTAPPVDPPSTMSSFPESTFDFDLPVYSNELGRLPVWPDLTADASSLATPIDGAWPPLAPPPYATQVSEPMFPAPALMGIEGSQLGFDPDLEAIFQNFLPEGSSTSAFATLRQGDGSAYPVGQHAAGSHAVFTDGFGGVSPASISPGNNHIASALSREQTNPDAWGWRYDLT